MLGQATPSPSAWLPKAASVRISESDSRGSAKESAGTRAFGHMPLARVILQKGDNFRVPERPREKLRYASDYAVFLGPTASQPQVEFVREKIQ